MFTFDQIKELVELVARYRLHGLEIERAGFQLRITGEAAKLPTAPPPATAAAGAAGSTPAAAASAALRSEAAPASSAAHLDIVELHVISSPIVGTFYASPSPDAAAFVRTGDRVRKGQVLCIVEAMKLMNEIESDADGVVVEVFPKNAQPVEYGEPLFGLRRD